MKLATPGPDRATNDWQKLPNFGQGALILMAVAPELWTLYQISMAHLNSMNNGVVSRLGGPIDVVLKQTILIKQNRYVRYGGPRKRTFWHLIMNMQSRMNILVYYANPCTFFFVLEIQNEQKYCVRRQDIFGNVYITIYSFW